MLMLINDEKREIFIFDVALKKEIFVNVFQASFKKKKNLHT